MEVDTHLEGKGLVGKDASDSIRLCPCLWFFFFFLLIHVLAENLSCASLIPSSLLKVLSRPEHPRLLSRLNQNTLRLSRLFQSQAYSSGNLLLAAHKRSS